MPQLDDWIDILIRHGAGQALLTPGQPVQVAVADKVSQQQIEDALSALVPAETIAGLARGGRYWFPYQANGATFNIGLEKHHNTLRLRIVRQDTFTRDAADLIELSLIY